MAGKSFPELISVDLVAGDSRAANAVSTARLSHMRSEPSAQESAVICSSRHLLIVPTSGVGKHVVDTMTFDIEPGSLLHIEPGQAHRWLPEETFDGWMIAIDQHVCPPWLFDVPASSPLVLLGASMEVVDALVASLTTPELLPPAAEQRLRLSMASVLLELIAGVGDRTALQPDAIAEHRIVSDFRRELEFNYLSTRAVGDYARLVGCSAKTLTRATNRVLGQTPKEAIDRRVAYAACRLLANTDLSISWIAYKLGFSEQSNFSKFFHRKVDMTPAEYRVFSTTGPAL